MADSSDPHDRSRIAVSVELCDRHLAYLDRLSERIRKATGGLLPPSAIIRAMVDALVEAAAIDPSAIATEEDLTDLFYRRLTRQEDRKSNRDRMRS